VRVSTTRNVSFTFSLARRCTSREPADHHRWRSAHHQYPPSGDFLITTALLIDAGLATDHRRRVTITLADSVDLDAARSSGRTPGRQPDQMKTTEPRNTMDLDGDRSVGSNSNGGNAQNQAPAADRSPVVAGCEPR
jgi:hypothetical protein